MGIDLCFFYIRPFFLHVPTFISVRCASGVAYKVHLRRQPYSVTAAALFPPAQGGQLRKRKARKGKDRTTNPSKKRTTNNPPPSFFTLVSRSTSVATSSNSFNSS